MPEQVKPDSQIENRESAQQRGISRRNLLRAGLSAAPVVLAVSGRSAMATTCAKGLSPLAWNSLAPNGACNEASHTVTTNTLGVSPEFWKPNKNGATFQTPAWPTGVAPFQTIIMRTHAGINKTVDWNRSRYLDYYGISWDATGWDTGKKFNSIFTIASDTRSFSRILIADNGT